MSVRQLFVVTFASSLAASALWTQWTVMMQMSDLSANQPQSVPEVATSNVPSIISSSPLDTSVKVTTSTTRRLPGLEHRLKLYDEKYQFAPSQEEHPPPNTEICGTAPAYTEFFKQNKEGRSDNNEDQKIYDFFFQNGPFLGEGRYVEMGAFDGVRESNSRFFDVCLGWQGLLVEGNPAMYDRLRNNRPHAHRMFFAPSCSASDERSNTTVSFHDYPQTNTGQAGFAKSYDGKRIVEVPCGPLTPILLDLFPGGHVHFFSLDVEGAEPFVVKNIDFDAVFIEVLMVESRNSFCQAVCETRDQVREHMKGNGYALYTGVIPKSDIYIHNKSDYRLPDTFQPAVSM